MRSAKECEDRLYSSRLYQQRERAFLETRQAAINAAVEYCRLRGWWQ